ncbi:MAG: hypothetical protein ABIM44_07950, partial [candidate division WOR-3 bacterium]
MKAAWPKKVILMGVSSFKGLSISFCGTSNFSSTAYTNILGSAEPFSISLSVKTGFSSSSC